MSAVEVLSILDGMGIVEGVDKAIFSQEEQRPQVHAGRLSFTWRLILFSASDQQPQEPDTRQSDLLSAQLFPLRRETLRMFE